MVHLQSLHSCWGLALECRKHDDECFWVMVLVSVMGVRQVRRGQWSAPWLSGRGDLWVHHCFQTHPHLTGADESEHGWIDLVVSQTGHSKPHTSANWNLEKITLWTMWTYSYYSQRNETFFIVRSDNKIRS